MVSSAAELAAMKVIYSTLKPLQREVQKRIMHWLENRLEYDRSIARDYEYCCECGAEYPARDLELDGIIYCVECRAKLQENK